MKVFLDGRGLIIKDLDGSDARSLLKMINDARLNERRTFYELKRQLEEMIEQGLIDK